MAALGVNFRLEPLLGIAGVAALGIDLDVEPLLSLPRIAPLAFHPRLNLTVNSLPPANLPRHGSYTSDGTRLAEDRRRSQRHLDRGPVLADPVCLVPLRAAARDDPPQHLCFLGSHVRRADDIRGAADDLLLQVSVEEYRGRIPAAHDASPGD